jgi:hypothetical protein
MNGAFDFDYLNVDGATFSITSATASPISSFETGGIRVNNGGALNLSLGSLVFNDAFTGWQYGAISLLDGSTAQIGIMQDASFPALNVGRGSNLRLAQEFQSGRYLLTVQDLGVGWGGIINTNAAGGGGKNNILVENSITAAYNSFIQFGVVDVSSPPSTLAIANGCASKGLVTDLCDLIAE